MSRDELRETFFLECEDLLEVLMNGLSSMEDGSGDDETIKTISQMARHEMEEFLGRKVHLFLVVKVRPNWLEEAERYSEMGLDFSDGNT